MPKADFQERLQRLNANTPQLQPIKQHTTHRGKTKVKKMNRGLFAFGCFLMSIGVQIIRYLNSNYEAIRDSHGIETVVGFGLFAIVILLIAFKVAMRAMKKQNVSEPTGDIEKPLRQTSTRARVITSLLGCVLGAIACFYMFSAAAARFVETEVAQTFSIGGYFITFLLAFVSLLFGLVGLFLRGYALGRVPVYFLFGGILVFASFRIFGVNMLEWQWFVAELQ